MAYIQTIGRPNYIPEDYFTKENVEFIQRKVTEMIHKDISTDVTIDTSSIVRVMQRILEQRLEEIPALNQRVIMELTRHYLNYQVEANRNLWWTDMFRESQRLYDSNARRGVIANWSVKQNHKKTPTTVRFYFT
jgi:restriction endonuclease